ncbi:Copper amine oxidase N-terminal domain-containing protein [Caloramator fervidus]|mgnify:CR=1 FL=1|uniref:Copper amine oxidase N-terminal domain-containing protein n=1 Tax=Caloramator fervidus TaxID=29344 RepID=A0A1H5XS54_9CLOT|nr:copper amine oxidase N-terminal domain-containing protein [Caloramator fervidus]SEG14483.1 Copper amine oxidase N-terminal domain-containing protein [Caloramator fervidus]
MKKALLTIVLGAFITTSINLPTYAKPLKASASNKNQTLLNQKQVESKENRQIKTEKTTKKFKDKVPPVIKFGKTVIPITAISRGLKAEVKWDKASQTLLITKNGNTIEIIAGSKILVNSEELNKSILKKIQGSLMHFIKSTLNNKSSKQTKPNTESNTTQQTEQSNQDNTTNNPSPNNQPNPTQDNQQNSQSNQDNMQTNTETNSQSGETIEQ